MGISSFVAGLGLLAFPYINSLVSRTIMLKAMVITVVHQLMNLHYWTWYGYCYCATSIKWIQGAINKIIPLLIMGTFSCLGGIVSSFLLRWFWILFASWSSRLELYCLLPDCSLPAGDFVQALAQHLGGGGNLWNQLQHLQLSLELKVGDFFGKTNCISVPCLQKRWVNVW